MCPVMAVGEGQSVDINALQLHMIGGKDARLTPGGDPQERVYMPTTLSRFWADHRALWRTQIRQHAQLTPAGTAVVQKYCTLRPVRRWLRQLTRDYNPWESATARLWDENVVTALYMQRTHHRASHQGTVHDHRRRVRLLYGFQSHQIRRGSEKISRKHRRRDTIP